MKPTIFEISVIAVGMFIVLGGLSLYMGCIDGDAEGEKAGWIMTIVIETMWIGGNILGLF